MRYICNSLHAFAMHCGRIGWCKISITRKKKRKRSRNTQITQIRGNFHDICSKQTFFNTILTVNSHDCGCCTCRRPSAYYQVCFMIHDQGGYGIDFNEVANTIFVIIIQF
jgi:hypothetical protein